MMDGDDHAADHHLRFLLRDPIQHQDAGLHIHHAHVLARLGRPQESAARLAWALLLDPRVHLRPINYNVSHRSNAAAEAGDWARAIRGYRLAVTLPMYEYSSDLLAQLRGYDSIPLVLAEIASGVPPASRYRLREAECRQFQWVALRLALCVPMPPASTRGLHMVALATHRATRRPYASGRLGAAQYRMGRFEDAARTLALAAEAPERDEETFVPLFQALTAKRLGHDAEAKAALVRAETARRIHPDNDWRDRIALGALFAETRAALSAPPRMTRVPEGE